jgi:alginate O-acetyltransferase complex protein AlgJ
VKLLERLLLLAICAVFTIPALLTLLISSQPGLWPKAAWLRNRTLVGAIVLQTSPVALSRSTLYAGTYQTSTAQRFNEMFAGRELLIRVTNETWLRVFETTGLRALAEAAQAGGRFVLNLTVGRDRALFEESYLQEYCVRRGEPQALAPFVQQIKTLQDALLNKGVGFALVLSPGKASIYPEKIPKRWLNRYDPRPRLLDQFRQLLQSAGVQYVDGATLTASVKKTAPAPVFPKGGQHWDDYAAWQTTNATLDLFRQQGVPVRTIDDVKIEYPDEPTGDEIELVEMMNLAVPWHYKTVRIRPRPLSLPNKERLNFAVVGDSFSWKMARLLAACGQFSEIDNYFYYKMAKKCFCDGDEIIVAAPLEQVNFAHEIFAADCLMLEINEVWLARSPFLEQFVSDAVQHLAQLQASRESFISDIYQPCVLGGSLSFRKGDQGEIKQSALSGFGKSEAVGTWTEGNRAVVRLTAPLLDRDLIVRILAGAFVPPGRNQHVRIFANDEQVSDLHIVEGSLHEYEIAIPVRLISRNKLHLRFDIERPVSPNEAGVNTDVRKLTLLLVSLAVGVN